MKTYISLLIFILCLSRSNAQDSCLVKFSDWMSKNNISIRKTFDGSKNESKPASFAYQENYKSENDFFILDLGIKLSEIELLKDKSSSLIFYPKIEWHRSTDSTDLKNKLDGGINFEFLPFPLKSPDLNKELSNNGLIISPWFQGGLSFKRNLLTNVFETKLTGQISFMSNYKFLPGYLFRDKKYNFRGRYYPYIGIELNNIPDLISKGQTEKFSIVFVRLYIECWILPKSMEVIFDGVYRQNIENSSQLRKDLPFCSTSINFYPGKQEAFSIGYEYKHGFDSDSKYQLIQISSLKFNAKF